MFPRLQGNTQGWQNKTPVMKNDGFRVETNLIYTHKRKRANTMTFNRKFITSSTSLKTIVNKPATRASN